jgi:hypothetical protein
MFYNVYYSPYAAYARYALPWYVPGYGICTNPYACMSQAIIDSQIQNASQEIKNTGTMSGTSQYINQTTV